MFALVNGTFALLDLRSVLLGSDWSVLVTGERGKQEGFSDNTTFALRLRCLIGVIFICCIMSVAGSHSGSVVFCHDSFVFAETSVHDVVIY